MSTLPWLVGAALQLRVKFGNFSAPFDSLSHRRCYKVSASASECRLFFLTQSDVFWLVVVEEIQCFLRRKHFANCHEAKRVQYSLKKSHFPTWKLDGKETSLSVSVIAPSRRYTDNWRVSGARNTKNTDWEYHQGALKQWLRPQQKKTCTFAFLWTFLDYT